jgi:hypothetical protein
MMTNQHLPILWVHESLDSGRNPSTNHQYISSPLRSLKESGFWTLSIIQCLLKNTTFWKLDLFPSQSLVQ